MFERFGRLMYRRRRWIVVATALFVVFAGVWGTQVFGSLVAGGFEDPGSDSYRAAKVSADELGRDDADVIVLYRSTDSTVDDPAFQRAVTSTVDALPSDAVERTVTFWSTKSPALVSEDRHATYVVLGLRGDEGERTEALERIEGKLDAPGLETQLGGGTVINRDITERIQADIARAETISMPVLLILLVVIFGSLAAASLPLAIGGIAILGAFTALRAITYFSDVSIFSINVVTIMGLGLAIDYGLFMVSRFREEIGRAATVEDAVARTMATAGRTVAVSGVTVAISLAGLLIFPQVFLRSMGMGGIAAVLIAMGAALTLLPALFGMLGHRVDALSIRRRSRPAVGRGAWYRIAHSVMRRPVIFTVAIVAVLVALGLPFLRVQFGGVDERVLPAGTESRTVAETINRDFPPTSTSPIEAIVTGPGASEYLAAVRGLDGVVGADITGQSGGTTRISIRYSGEAISDEARDLVQQARELPVSPGTDVRVGGRSAELVDLLASLGRLLPWMALMVGITTFVLLFLAFGSVVLPIKAIVMNVLSLAASFGALVWIFQDGNLAGALDFTATGSLDATQPILVLAIIFGLSMDYEVFLMSRIREQYDLTGDNTQAVATGLQRTGRIITSAALLLIVVTAAFSLSGITFIKLIGVAMIIAIVVDATVVRALLVPATMRLLGRANWWAPAPLRRFYARYGIREEDSGPAPQRELVGAAR
jgi:uncharacterized membrane protein YdfJ with MMPL/SSD domain